MALLVNGFAMPAGAGTVDDEKQAVEAAHSDLQALLDRISMLDEDYNAARIELAQLDQELADTEAVVEEAQAELEQRRAEAREFAVEAYIHGSSVDFVDVMQSDTIDESQRRRAYAQVAIGDGRHVMDQLAAAQEDADAQVAELEAKRAEADAKREELADTKAELEAQVQVAQSRLDEARSELDQAQAEQAREQAAARAEGTTTTAAPSTDTTESADTTESTTTTDAPSSTTTLPRRVAETPPEPPRAEPPPPPAPDTSGDVQSVIDEAYRQIGVPYVWAGSTPQQGFDCSGFTSWVWAKGGVNLPHSSRAQYGVTARISRSQLQPGDLVFYGSPIHHVALYVGGGKIVHAPSSGSTVRENSIDYWDAITGYGRV